MGFSSLFWQKIIFLFWRFWLNWVVHHFFESSMAYKRQKIVLWPFYKIWLVLWPLGTLSLKIMIIFMGLYSNKVFKLNIIIVICEYEIQCRQGTTICIFVIVWSFFKRVWLLYLYKCIKTKFIIFSVFNQKLTK